MPDKSRAARGAPPPLRAREQRSPVPDRGSNSDRAQDLPAGPGGDAELGTPGEVDPGLLATMMSGMPGGQGDGGGFGDWWTENVSDPLRAFDNSLMGGGDASSGEKRGGLVLYWKGNGDQGPAMAGSGDNESLDITDIMTAFGAMSKSLKMSPATLMGSDAKSWYAAAKSWKKLYGLIFEKIPAAVEMTAEDLRAFGLMDEAVDGFIEAKAEYLQKSAESTEDQLLEDSDDGPTAGPSVDLPSGEEIGGHVELPGWTTVVDASGEVHGVRDWRLPVTQWSRQVESQAGTAHFLKVEYADGSVQFFMEQKGHFVAIPSSSAEQLQGASVPGVEDGGWVLEKTRERSGAFWVSETGWSTGLRSSQ